MDNKDKKAPKAPAEHADKKDQLEDKDQKNTDLKPAGLNEIGDHEYEEDHTTEIRMKPQPFRKEEPSLKDHDSDGL